MSSYVRQYEQPCYHYQPSQRLQCGCVEEGYYYYYKIPRPSCCERRPMARRRESKPYKGLNTNAPCNSPCCYGMPCIAHCLNGFGPREPENNFIGCLVCREPGFEPCCRPCPRYGVVRGEYSIYYKRPRCGQPRPQPFQRECAPYYGGPGNAPCERPCCYDFPCKAHCFNHGACTRPSGRYARTVWYPGECCPAVPPCQAFTCPNPPYHPCCYHTCNRIV